MVWTRFMDMHSGGGLKVPPYDYIFIEAPEERARAVFYHRFDRNPDYVTCDCCGEDYSVDEASTLEQATGFDRHCRYDNTKRQYVEEVNPDYVKYGQLYIPLDAYINQPNVLFIFAEDIKPEDTREPCPEGHWEWVED